MINKKTMILLISLLVLVIGLSTVSAEDAAGDETIVLDDGVETISDVDEGIEEVSVDDAQEVKTVDNNKKLGANPTEYTVNNFNQLYNTAYNICWSYPQVSEVIINLNDGNYAMSDYLELMKWDDNDEQIEINWTINGNNQVIIDSSRENSMYIGKGVQYINNLTISTNRFVIDESIIYLNNCTINSNNIPIWDSATVYFNNCTINSNIEDEVGSTLIIDDNTSFGPNTKITGASTIIINDTSRIAPYCSTIFGNVTKVNETISNSEEIVNKGTYTFINCSINLTQFTNAGNVNVINSTIIYLGKDGWGLSGNATIENSIFTKQLQVDSSGNITLINSTFSDMNMDQQAVFNLGNLTVIKCTFQDITATQYGAIYNNGNLCLNDTDFININGSAINNTGVIDLIDNCRFINCSHQVIYSPTKVGSTIYPAYHVNITNSLFENCTGFSIDDLTLINTSFINVTNPVSCNKSVVDNCSFINCSAVNTGILTTGLYEWAGNLASGTNISNTVNNTKFINCITTRQTGYGVGTARLSNYPLILTTSNLTVSNSIFNCSDVESIVYSIRTGFDYNINNNINIVNNTFIGNELGENGGINLTITDNITVANNTFNSTSNNLINKTSVDTTSVIENNSYINCSIPFSVLNITAPEKVYSNTTVDIIGTIVLEDPDSYDSDILDKTKYNFFIADELYASTDTFNISVFKDDSNMIIYAQPSISNKVSNILVLKTNLLTSVIITPENYKSYIFHGELIGIDEDTNITFQGEFNNIGPVNIDTSYISLNGTDATFTNTTFIIESDNVNMYNMNIDNTDTSRYAIESTGINNQFINNTIKVNNSNGLTAAISTQGVDNNTIDGNDITLYGPSVSTMMDGNAIISQTQAILVKDSSNVRVINNKVTVSNSTDADADLFSTIEAITVSGNIENALISYNNVTVSGARFIYGIDSLNTVNNETISYNNINVFGHRYTDGIQVGNDASNILIEYNNITTECHNNTVFDADNEAISYGIITSNMGGSISENITIANNNIQQDSTINYGMEIYQTPNTNITSNNITGNGGYSMGIGLSYATNSTVTDNNMVLTGDTNQTINYIVEEIRPGNVGVQVQNGTQNVLIDNNTIKTYDTLNTDVAVSNEENNVTITNNKLLTSTTGGNEAVKTTATDTVIANNTKALYGVTVTIEDVTANVLDEVTLNVNVINELGDAFTGGRVSFKVNGNYLKDASGEYVRANVINGIATATVTIAKQYVGENTLVAYFTGNSKYDKALSDEASLTVGKQDVTITIDLVEATVTESMTITAHITDSNANAVSGGRVSFKVNGNYLKDSEGKYIYANVKDGIVTINTTALNKWVGNNSTIQVCYGGNNYYNAAKSTEDTMSINKVNVTVTIAPITTARGSTAQFTAFVMTGNGKLINNGRVGFKVNGITLRNADSSAVYANVAGGVAVATVDVLDRWSSENTIQAVYGGTSIYNTARSTLSTMSITE